MNDSLKLVLVAGVFLAVGYFLGSSHGTSSGAGAGSANGEFVLSTPDTGRFLTNTRTGQVWVISSPNNPIDASAYHWTEIPTPSPRQ